VNLIVPSAGDLGIKLMVQPPENARFADQAHEYGSGCIVYGR
jgi:hypothetical protein